MGWIAILLLGVTLWRGAAATVLYESDFEGYRGTGLSPGGAPGRLDSRVWRVRGLSDGDGVFSGTHVGGDFARGESPGGVAAGGLYAFDVGGSAADRALGLQATGSDLTPGTVSLRLRNETPDALLGIAVSFELWIHNDGDRSTAMTVLLEHGDTLAPLVDLAAATPPRAAETPGWTSLTLSAGAPALRLDPGEDVLVHWVFDDASGSGSRDEVALDDVRVVALGRATPITEPTALHLAPLGLLAAASVGRRRRPVRPRRAPP